MKAVKKRILIMLPILILIILISIYFLFKSFIIFKIDNYKNTIDVNQEFKLPKVKVYFLGKNITDKLETDSNVDINKIGKYKITYKIKHLIFNKKKTISVNVVDKVLPEINLVGDSEVRLCPNKEYEEEGYKALDNYDGDITDKVNIIKNDDYIEYSVSDSSNNKVVVTRKIIKEDKTPPTIEILGNTNYTISLNSTFNPPSYNVSDNCDIDLKDKVEVINGVNTSSTGNYQVNYKVKDSSGNESDKIVYVKVINQTKVADYSNIVQGPTYINGILIVNKKYSLPSNYGSGVDPEANQALKNLQAGAKEAGHPMPLLSGYRSYYTQRNLYNSYVARDGQAAADTYSARPGHSEHQTGLAFDVGAISNNYGNTNAGIWLKNNAHKYGFIIRYPKGKEHITGYVYEPWHIRYVGTYHALKIYESGLTLEEYLGV